MATSPPVVTDVLKHFDYTTSALCEGRAAVIIYAREQQEFYNQLIRENRAQAEEIKKLREEIVALKSINK